MAGMAVTRWRRVFAVAAVVLGVAIFYVSTRPVQDLRDAHYPEINEWFDAGNHLLAFLVWQLLFRLGFRWRTPWCLVAGGGFAAACELAQLVVPTRGFQLLDLTVNVAPALAYEWLPPLRRLWLDDGPVWRRLVP